MKRVGGSASLLASLFGVTLIAAVTPPGQGKGAPGVPGTASAPSAPTGATCVANVPEGKEPPKLVETFPARGKSGHRAVLMVEVVHGPGERVLPSALDVDTDSPAFRALRSEGFRFPSAQGPSRPELRREEQGATARTRFSLPLLLLPEEPGRKEMTLPPLPIAISRSSGEIITVCTASHTITVEEPIANEPNPAPKANPAPGRQRELFVGLRNAVYGGALGLLLATALGLVVRAWRKRPKKAVPPPPPRPPWEVALEALADIRRSGWVEDGRFGEHFDRVSHVLRRYLGERYGFDALESTTREIVTALAGRQVGHEESELVRRFLDESDLVKFAKLTPTAAQYHWLWDTAQQVVERTRQHALTGPVPSEESSREA